MYKHKLTIILEKPYRLLFPRQLVSLVESNAYKAGERKELYTAKRTHEQVTLTNRNKSIAFKRMGLR